MIINVPWHLQDLDFETKTQDKLLTTSLGAVVRQH